MTIVTVILGAALFVAMAAGALALIDLATGYALARWAGEAGVGWHDWHCAASTRLRNLPLARTVVGHLAAISEMNLPLTTSLKVASRGQRRGERRAMKKLTDLLTLSVPLSEALRQSVANCPPTVVSLVAAGEHSGQLPRALRLAEDLIDEKLRRTQEYSLRAYWAYPAGLLVVGSMILIWVTTVIIPKFEAIFLDFDTALPATTRSLIDFAHWFVSGTVPGWVWLVGLIVVGFLVLLIHMVPPNGRVLRLLEAARDRVRFWLPVTRQIDWGQGMAAASGVLEMGLISGLPLERAACMASELRINGSLKQRLATFSARLAAGAPTVQAAREAGLGAMCVAAMAAVSRGEDPRVVLGHAADYYRALSNRWWHATLKIFWPLVALVLGAAVGYVLLAMFLPLVALIEHLIADVW